MPLRDLLKKKGRGGNSKGDVPETGGAVEPVPVPTIVRSDTLGQELLSASDAEPSDPPADSLGTGLRKRSLSFRRSSSKSPSPASPSQGKRQSWLRSHSRDSVLDSTKLPDIPDVSGSTGDKDDREAEWEKRATILADGNSKFQSDRKSLEGVGSVDPGLLEASDPSRPELKRQISSEKSDDDIQEAIRLHESGDLPAATAMFGRLADDGNALSQVLYGLALLHGWGIAATEPSRGVEYLSKAAANAAQVEKLALSSGMKKGGAAKGELVLAIYELANCYRNGLGVPRDPVAARVYLECCANLGDVEGANDAAYCYEHGIGAKKDKFAAAKYYRMAEEQGGRAIVGNSWIWKAKYDGHSKAGKS